MRRRVCFANSFRALPRARRPEPSRRSPRPFHAPGTRPLPLRTPRRVAAVAQNDGNRLSPPRPTYRVVVTPRGGIWTRGALAARLIFAWTGREACISSQPSSVASPPPCDAPLASPPPRSAAPPPRLSRPPSLPPSWPSPGEGASAEGDSLSSSLPPLPGSSTSNNRFRARAIARARDMRYSPLREVSRRRRGRFGISELRDARTHRPCAAPAPRSPPTPTARPTLARRRGRRSRSTAPRPAQRHKRVSARFPTQPRNVRPARPRDTVTCPPAARHSSPPVPHDPALTHTTTRCVFVYIAN
jgi:hypothetical protein